MLTDLLIALIVLTNFTLVTTTRINKAIQVAVVQGVLLGLLPLAMGLGRHLHILLMHPLGNSQKNRGPVQRHAHKTAGGN